MLAAADAEEEVGDFRNSFFSFFSIFFSKSEALSRLSLLRAPAHLYCVNMSNKFKNEVQIIIHDPQAKAASLERLYGLLGEIESSMTDGLRDVALLSIAKALATTMERLM